MSDEELDDVVRRSAEAYPDEVPLGSWLRMEDKLNQAAMQQEVRQRVNRRVGRLFALEVLLVALALLWWQGRQLLFDEKQPAISAASAVGTVTAPAAAPTTAQSKRQQPQGLAATTPRLAPSAPASSLSQGSTAPAASPGEDRQNDASVASATSARINLFPVPVASERRSAGSFRSFDFSPHAAAPESRTLKPDNFTRYQTPTQTTAEKPALDVETPLTALTGKDAAAAKSPTEAATPTTPTSAPTLVAKPADSLAKTAVAAPVLPTATDSLPLKAKRERPAYRLVVGVMGAPELTAVHTKELTRPGNTVGAVVEYRFMPRLRVRTGVLRSVKLYSARGSDYKPPADYWTWRVPVKRIDADCDILEIPLDLRYDLLQRPTYSLFASAGLTSLLMRNEEYTYGYDRQGQYVKYTWDYARGSNHPLSMLSVSVGYERVLKGRWSAQAEPFLKLPLGGVGFGKIHLRSTGVSFGVKYGLLPSRATPAVP